MAVHAVRCRIFMLYSLEIPGRSSREQGAFMKDDKEDAMAWVKKHMGKEQMQQLTDMTIAGMEFELQFLKNPAEFCAANQYKVYLGRGPNAEFDKTYVFVYQQDTDAFATVWIYPDGHVPALVLKRQALQNLIERFDFSFIDHEIFLLWLHESQDLIQKAYKTCKRNYKKLMALEADPNNH